MSPDTRQTIGESLEEARKRRGISLREAAEATKIRSDYLLSLENNAQDIDLPEVYRRGFLRIYAKYLKLDPEKILTDYDATVLGKTARGSQAHPPPLGRLDLGDSDDGPEADIPTGFAESGNPLARKQANSNDNGDNDDGDARNSEAGETTETESDNADTPAPARKRTVRQARAAQDFLEDPPTPQGPRYFRAFLYVLVAFALLFTGYLFATWMASEPSPPAASGELSGPEPNATGSNTAATSPAASADDPAPAPVENLPPAEPVTPPPATSAADTAAVEEITLQALEEVTVIVQQRVDRLVLFNDTLSAGERVTLEKSGPIIIRFTKGDALILERNGQRYRMGVAGLGSTTFD